MDLLFPVYHHFHTIYIYINRNKIVLNQTEPSSESFKTGQKPIISSRRTAAAMHQPELYADISRNFFQQRPADVTRMLDSLTWPEDSKRVVRVLDVGCGPGDYTARDLLPRLREVRDGCHVVGVDSEPSMVRYANEHHASAGTLSFHQLDISQRDVEAAEFWKETAPPFDKIFSYYCLHWVKDQRQAAKNLFKLLSDDRGEMVTVFPTKNGIAEAYGILAGNSRWGKYLQDYEKFVWAYQDSEDPAQEFRDLLEETGFTVETCVCETRHYSYRTKEEAKEMLSSINPFLNRIPEEDRSDFLEDLVSECFKSKFLNESKVEGLEVVGIGESLVVKARKDKKM